MIATRFLGWGVLLVCVLLAGCASGGAGTGNAPPPSGPVSSEPAATSLDDIKQPYAIQDGETGAGVTVAVVDSGILATHEMFANTNIVKPASMVTTESSTDYNDYTGHGTGVEGVVVQTAPGANLMPVRIYDKSGNTTDTWLDNGIEYAASNGAKVINISVGGPGSSGDTTALTDAVNAGAVVVIGAGNGGGTNPDGLAMNATNTALAGHIIVVGSVNPTTNQISSFSNQAGSAENYFLVAPGEGVETAGIASNTDIVPDSGTSFATPFVSGAVALLEQKWPTLTASQIVSILFNTATDLGAPGVDPVYGHGLLNLQAAIQPQGTAVIPTGQTLQGAAIPVSDSSARLGSAFGDALANWQPHGIILDSYNRDFPVIFSGWVHSASVQTSLANWFDSAHGVQGTWNDPIDGLSVRSSMIAQPIYTGGNVSAWEDPRTGYTMNTLSVGGQLDGVGWRAFHEDQAQPVLGPGDVPWLRGTATLDGGYGQSLGSTSGFAVQWAPGQNMRLELGQNGSAVATHVRLASGTHWSVAALGGLLNENHLFGTQSSGSLAFGQNTHTAYLGLAGGYSLSPHLAIQAALRDGQTSMSPTPGSLFRYFSPVRSMSGAIDLAYQGKDVDAGLVYAQPLRVTSGTAQVSVPVSVDSLGNITYADQSVSLRPSGREQDWQAFVSLPSLGGGTLRTALLYTQDPGHDALAQPVKAVALEYDSRW